MSTNLPLNWLDKKNSPELEAFLKQYGDQYYMTAEQINQLRDAVNEMAVIQQSTFLGAAEPTFTPAGTGRAYWIAVKAGTYTNYGAVVVAANEIAFIIRDAVGAFSISKAPFVIPQASNKITPWTAIAFSSGDQVNHLGKDWTANAATVASDIPGTSSKWVDRLSQKNDKAVFDSVIKIDELGNLYFADVNGNIGAILKSNGTLVINDVSIKNQTSSILLNYLKLNNIDVTGLINGNTIKQNDNYALVITDENGNIGYSLDLNANQIIAPKRKSGMLADINHIVSYGQSLSIGALGTPVITTTTEDSVYTFFKGPVMIDFDADATKYNSLALEVETSVETVCGTMGRMLKQQIRTDGFLIDGTTNLYDILVSAPGQANQKILQLAKGTSNYTRFIDGVNAGKSLANSNGKTYNLPAVFWLQGEANQGEDKINYKNTLIQLRKDINADVKAITGQKNDVIFLNYQMATHNWSTGKYPTIALALNEMALSKEVGFYSGIPLYPYTHTSDQLHMIGSSYAKAGALAGYILKKILIDGIDWKPIHVKETFFNGSTLNLIFNVPSPPLVLDTTIVVNPGNYGFRLFDASGTEITITAVSTPRPDTVKITASIPIVAGMKLTYAINGTAGKSGPTEGSRGCLRDSQGVTLKYKPATLNYELHNWTPIFEQTL